MSLYPIPQPGERTSISRLVRQLVTDFNDLSRQYMTLTRTEVREEGQRLSKAVLYGLVALILLQVVLIFLGNLLMLFLMVNQMTVLNATLLTMGLYLLLALVCGVLCIRQLQAAQALLKQKPSSS